MVVKTSSLMLLLLSSSLLSSECRCNGSSYSSASPFDSYYRSRGRSPNDEPFRGLSGNQAEHDGVILAVLVERGRMERTSEMTDLLGGEALEGRTTTTIQHVYGVAMIIILFVENKIIR